MSVNFENLLSSTQKFIKELEEFILLTHNSQKKHELAINKGQKMRETFTFYLERTENEAKTGKVLEFTKKLIRNLYCELNGLEKEIILLNRNKEKLSSMWSVYSALSSVVTKYPNANSNKIRFEMYEKIPKWEDYIEDSTNQLLQNLESGLANTADLAENTKNILSAILTKSGKYSSSRISEINSAKKDYEEKKAIISEYLSKLIELANALSKILENAFF